jgi:hypothetical protein
MKRPGVPKRKTPLLRKSFEQKVRARLRRYPPKRRHGEIVSAIWRRDLGGCIVCPFEGGTCAGPVEAHHLIPAAVLRKHGLAAFLMDVRNRAAVCSHRHEQITSAYKPFPVALLSDVFFEFAADAGLMWWVDRHFPDAKAAA